MRREVERCWFSRDPSFSLRGPFHHRRCFLFYSGLLKCNGGEKVHIQLAWEWGGGGGVVASRLCPLCSRGNLGKEGSQSCRQSREPTRTGCFEKKEITGLPTQVTGIIYDPSLNLLLSLPPTSGSALSRLSKVNFNTHFVWNYIHARCIMCESASGMKMGNFIISTTCVQDYSLKMWRKEPLGKPRCRWNIY
jgi:hypothetical protein